MFTLTSIEMKRNGEISCCGVNDIHVRIQENERVREGVTVLLKNVHYRIVVIVFWCIFSRIPRVKYRFARMKVCDSVLLGREEKILK